MHCSSFDSNRGSGGGGRGGGYHDHHSFDSNRGSGGGGRGGGYHDHHSFDSNRGAASTRGGRGGGGGYTRGGGGGYTRGGGDGYRHCSDSTRGRGSNGGRGGTNSVSYGVSPDHSFATRFSPSRNNNVGHGRGGVAASFGQPLDSGTNRWSTAAANWAEAYAAQAYASAARRVPAGDGSAERRDAFVWGVSNSGWANDDEEFANCDWGNNSNRGVDPRGLNDGGQTSGQTAWGVDSSWNHVAALPTAETNTAASQPGWSEQDEGLRGVPATPPIPTEGEGGNGSVEQQPPPPPTLAPVVAVTTVEERFASAEREHAVLRTTCDALRTQHDTLRLEHANLRSEHNTLRIAFEELRSTLAMLFEQQRVAGNTALASLGQTSL